MGVLFDYPQVLSNEQPREETPEANLRHADYNGFSTYWSRQSWQQQEVPKPHQAHSLSYEVKEDDVSIGSSDGEGESSVGDSETSSVRSYETSYTSYSEDSIPDGGHDPEQQRQVYNHEDPGYYSLVTDAEVREQEAVLPKLEEERLECPASIDLPFRREGVHLSSELPAVAHKPTLSTDLKPPVGHPIQHQHETTVQPTFPRSRCRRRCSESNGVQPPRLKRDTDSADAFVNLLIAFTCRLVTAIWPLAATPPMMTACFNGAGVLPLHTFIYETLRRSKTSYSTLQIALYYLVMLKPKLPGLDFTKEQPKQSSNSGKQAHGCRAMQCGRRMFLSALMLASKYIQDRNYSTRAWSKISGLRIPEINDNEREYLDLINYNLHMKQETFENWSKVVLLLSRISRLQPPGCFNEASQTSKFNPGADATEFTKSAAASQHTGLESPEVYSNQWWTELCGDLDPELFKDTAKTDAFIAQHIRPEHTSAHIPPILPSAGQGSSDMTFSDPFGSRGPPSNVSTPIQMAASSPAQLSDLPMRPQPRKLQTPQSTPHGTDLPAGLRTSPCQKIPRTSASVDALRNVCMRKAFHANIDRCPPPQTPLPPYSQQMGSTLHTPDSSAGPSPPPTSYRPGFVISPERMANRGCRSRSSSISSTSSASSSASSRYDTPSSSCSPSTMVRTRFFNGHFQPCLVSETGETLRPLRRKPPFVLPGLPGSEERGQSHPVDDNGKGVPVDLRATNDYADAFAASALMDLRVGDRESLTPQPAPISQPQSRNATPKASQQCSRLRRHKRTISKTNENLQGNVRGLLQANGCQIGVMEDASEDSPTSYPSTVEEKQLQKPNRSWAQLKQPVSNAQLNKRLAVDCASQQRQISAPELARTFLRPDLQQLVGWDGEM